MPLGFWKAQNKVLLIVLTGDTSVSVLGGAVVRGFIVCGLV